MYEQVKMSANDLAVYFTLLVASAPPSQHPMIGERQAASLLFLALSEGIFDQPDKKSGWKKNKLKQNGKRAAYRKYLEWRSANQKNLSTHLDLSNFLVYRYQDIFSRICIQDQDGGVIWNMAGQKDDPILLILKDSDKPLFPGEEDKLLHIIPASLKFNHLHYLSGDMVDGALTNVKSTGGGKEVINSYFHTYHLHCENVYPLMIDHSSLTKIWSSQKFIALIKRMVAGEEETLENKIDQCLKMIRNQNTDRKWLLKELARIYFCDIFPDYHTSSCYYDDEILLEKFFRIEQVFGIEIPPILKTDRELEFEKSKKFLESLLSRMIDRLIPKMVKVDTLSDIDLSLFSLPSVLIEEWKKSPKHPTPLFVQKWLEFGYEPINVGQYFVSESSGTDQLLKLQGMKDKVSLIPQRGTEWLEFYSLHFEPENNSHRYISDDMTPQELLIARHNLIRGNIAETWVLDYIQHHETHEGHLAQVGMIKDDEKFYSPDGLLVNEQEIVPIEVKTIMGCPGLTSSFFRDYDLARLQLLGVAGILNSKLEQPLATRGLGYFLFIHQPLGEWCFDLYKVEYDLIP